MVVSKVIIGSTNPSIAKILSELTQEEKRFLSIIEGKDAFMKAVKGTAECAAVVDVTVPWECLSSLPSNLLTMNKKARIILVSENGEGPATFQTIIKPNQLLGLSKRIISKNWE